MRPGPAAGSPERPLPHQVAVLAVAAGGLWLRRFTRMGCWFLIGFSVSLLATYVSVLLGGRSNVLATVVFVLGLVGQVAALVLTIDAATRGPQAEETRLDLLARTVGPFLAVYAVWGLVEDEISNLFVVNVALQGLGGTETWSINLSRIWLYVGLAAAAWLLRRLLARLADRVPPRVLLLPGVLVEGVWVVASLLALFTLVRQGLDWLQGRAVWQAVRTAWQQLLAPLPDLRLPFDVTLPEAVAALAGWFWTVLLPGLSSGVLLPLLWLALTATVLGWPDPQTTPLRRLRDLVADRTRTPTARLAVGAGRLLTADLRTKYLPVLRALRFVLSAGWRFVLAYLILATAVTTARGWGALGLERLLGPQSATGTLAWWAVVNLAEGLLFSTLAAAVYATGYTRVRSLTSRTPPAPAPPPAPAAAAPGPPRRPGS